MLAAFSLLEAQSAGLAPRLSQVISDPREKDLALTRLSAKNYTDLAQLLNKKQSLPSANRAEILSLEGAIAFVAGDMSSSVRHFSEASALAPLSDSDAFTCSMAYIKLGDRNHAASLLSRLSVSHPDQFLYIYWLGRIDYDLRRYPEAVDKLKNAVALAPTSARVWNALGLAYDMQGQTEQAFEPLSKAAQLNREGLSPSPWPPHDLGAWYLRSNRWKEAQQCFEEALRYQPALAPAHYHLGRALEKQGQHQPAITEYQTAISSDRSSVDACYSLAMLYRKLGREREATAMLTEYRARKTAPQANERSSAKQADRQKARAPQQADAQAAQE